MRVTLSTVMLLPLLACAPDREPTAPTEAPNLVAVAKGYRVLNLGFPGVASGVSDAGHIVGSRGPSGTPQAFLWYNGVVTDLGTLGGCCSTASAVNASGEVVGESQTAAGPAHAFSWKNGVMTDLGTFGAGISRALDVNAAGQIVGTSATGFIYDEGAFTSLGGANGTNFLPAALNDERQVAGQLGSHAALWIDGDFTDLGELGGGFSGAADINNSGAVVGISKLASGDYAAFIWRNGVIRRLRARGPLSVATAINDAGVIVGQRQARDDSFQAIIWTKGAARDLPSLGGHYSGASDINASGWVVGQSRRNDTDLAPYATLWIPE